ncbi:hypothetical protein NFX46_00165 [Streptomyces phaeoluteigriseus]|uniref:Sensor histidine kinase n=1 Tax=Streptomyces phaeoluteigriseus TaxID=114686 RepID=A0ABY4Z0G7_9ACTN|nr:hypothetical protein [Streptomyces phaeoluteigriseus]USQ82322.1 hypothetical protein NFX46_00165 [Streptomyces phaeoluteigriseus]
MGRTIRWAGRATGSPALATAMTFGTLLFVTALLLAAVGTLAVVGAWLLPETVLLRRIAGAARRPLRERVGTAVRDSGTLADLRWMTVHYAYG